jgi:hypothetical protein
MSVKRTRWRYARFFRALLPSSGVFAATGFVSIYLTLDSLVTNFGGAGNNLGRNLSAPVVTAFTVGAKFAPYLCPLVLAGLWQGPAGLARGHYPWLLKAHGLSASRSALLLLAPCLIDALTLWVCACMFSSLTSVLFQASLNPSLLRSAFGISPGQIGLWSIATVLPSVSLTLSIAGLWAAACLVLGSSGMAYAVSLVVYLGGHYLLSAVANLSFVSDWLFPQMAIPGISDASGYAVGHLCAGLAFAAAFVCVSMCWPRLIVARG